MRKLGGGDDESLIMRDRLIPFLIAAGVFAADRATKLIIERDVSMWGTHVIIPGFFQIIHTQNRGAAFSLLADADVSIRSVVLIGLSLVILVMIGVMLWNSAARLSNEPWTLRLGLSLVLGGAVGNVYDRIVKGSVTDFLDFYAGSYHFPTFNIADSAITIGAALMLISLWRGHREAVRT